MSGRKVRALIPNAHAAPSAATTTPANAGRTSVQRIWAEHGLKPHLTRTFKLSNDPRFEEKVRDVVGLYLNPPEKALVLSVDEIEPGHVDTIAAIRACTGLYPSRHRGAMPRKCETPRA